MGFPGRKMALAVADGHNPIRSHFRSCKNCSDDLEAELAERFVDAGSEVADCLGNVFHSGETHDAHDKFAQGRHHVRIVLDTYLGEVFALPPVLDIG